MPETLDQLRQAFERELAAALPSLTGPRADLAGAMRYACESGKRVRPLLCLASCAACGGSLQAAVPAAIAVEMVHCYSLVHDDLPAMDDDAQRRGRPTVHIKFGEAQAILAGDALLTEAFRVLADGIATAGAPHGTAASQATYAPRLLGQLVSELALAAGWQGMVGGQSEELVAPASAGLQAARRIAQLKTGELMRVACRMGAVAAGAVPADLDAITRFGELYGLAYQVIDDLNDRERDQQLGRQLNLAILLGSASAGTMGECYLNQALAVLGHGAWSGRTGLLRELVAMLAAAAPSG